MHCTGNTFIAKMREVMPERLVTSNIGTRFTFGA
jgi:metal-dependent hydrolase (beta-lactamase superfamily II)